MPQKKAPVTSVSNGTLHPRPSATFSGEILLSTSTNDELEKDNVKKKLSMSRVTVVTDVSTPLGIVSSTSIDAMADASKPAAELTLTDLLEHFDRRFEHFEMRLHQTLEAFRCDVRQDIDQVNKRLEKKWGSVQQVPQMQQQQPCDEEDPEGDEIEEQDVDSSEIHAIVEDEALLVFAEESTDEVMFGQDTHAEGFAALQLDVLAFDVSVEARMDLLRAVAGVDAMMQCLDMMMLQYRIAELIAGVLQMGMSMAAATGVNFNCREGATVVFDDGG
jgi:hypothetical protein